MGRPGGLGAGRGSAAGRGARRAPGSAGRRGELSAAPTPPAAPPACRPACLPARPAAVLGAGAGDRGRLCAAVRRQPGGAGAVGRRVPSSQAPRAVHASAHRAVLCPPAQGISRPPNCRSLLPRSQVHRMLQKELETTGKRGGLKVRRPSGQAGAVEQAAGRPQPTVCFRLRCACSGGAPYPLSPPIQPPTHPPPTHLDLSFTLPPQSFELPKAVHVEAELFSPANELLTPTFELRRTQLLRKYEPQASPGWARGVRGRSRRGCRQSGRWNESHRAAVPAGACQVLRSHRTDSTHAPPSD